MIAASLLAATVGLQPMEARLVRYPDIHGNQIVFTYASDLWISDLDGGIARRLTSDDGNEYRAAFSPDGKWIAFSGQYDGGTDVYVMEADGGEPKRLTYVNNSCLVMDWTPDGKIAYRSTAGSFTNRITRMWTVDPRGGTPEPSDLKDVSDLSFNSDGSMLALNRAGSHQFNWRYYRGGTQGRIAFYDLRTNGYEEIPAQRENSYFPMWVGNNVYFISDRAQNNLNLYVYNRGNKRISQITRFSDGDIKWPSSDGKKIVWERNGRLEVFDIASKQVNSFTPEVISDNMALRPRYRNVGNQVNNFDISPSGKRLAVEARGDIFSVPAKNGVTRNMTQSSDARDHSPIWSPDGQWIAYLSDASGEDRIWVQPQMGGEPKMLNTPAGKVITQIEWSPKGTYVAFSTNDGSIGYVPAMGGAAKIVHKDIAGVAGGDWSADEQYIAYVATQKNLFGAAMIYEVASGKKHQVTDGFFSVNGVTFDRNGKYLYTIENREYGFNPDSIQFATLHQQPFSRVYVRPLKADMKSPLLAPEDEEPVKAEGGPEPKAGSKPDQMTTIDFDGLDERAQPLPWPAGSYPFIMGANNGVFTWTNGTLVKFDLTSRSPQPIITGATGFAFNPSMTKMAYQAGPNVGIVDVRPGVTTAQGRVSMGDVAVMWDPREEFEQMYWQVWRYQRDNFYDPNMVGVDWDAIGNKYAKLLPYVGDRSDLNYLFGLMIGELGTGHAYVQGGELGTVTGGPSVGMLGADYEVSNGKVRFKKIYRGLNAEPGARGPLGAPGLDVREGDYLVSIDGVEVDADTNMYRLLINKANKIVNLKVNSRPSMIGARDVQVRPISNESNLRYRTWVNERRAMVEEMSNGEIGYMHIPDTSVQGVIGFVRGYYANSDKKAWVIDERYNGGGSIPTFFIEHLVRTYETALRPRHGIDIGFPTQTLDGPKAMLINEHAGSGGDMLPWLFKHSGLGPLIGTRTWGGLVGISGGAPLVDGGSVTSPSFGIYDVHTGEFIAENTGVDPDIEVDNTPEDLAKNQDPQLKRAVEWLQQQLRSGKGNAPFREPTFPNFGGGGSN